MTSSLIHQSDLTWQDGGIPHSAISRMESFFNAWKGTPYKHAARTCQMGTDCVQLGAAFMDFMFRSEVPMVLPSLSPDAGHNNYRGVWPIVTTLRSEYGGADIVRNNTLQRGDFIITRSIEPTEDATTNPGHLMIVGSKKWHIWHTTKNIGVHRTSIDNHRGILRIYRFRKKSTW